MSKKLSDEKLELMVEDVRATLAMEELHLSQDEIEVLKKYLKNELTREQVIEIFKKGLE